MNILANKKILNESIYEILKLDNSSAEEFLIIKQSLGYVMALVSSRFKRLYEDDSFTKISDQELMNIFRLINVPIESLQTILCFYRIIRNTTMHYYHPIQNNELKVDIEITDFITRRLEKAEVKDLFVVKEGNLTLFGAIAIISLSLDLNSERTSFFRVLSNGHKQTATDMSFDYFGKIPCQPKLPIDRRTKVRKFFEQYYLATQINFSLQVEKHFISTFENDKNETYTNTSFIKMLREVSAKGKKNLNYLRNIGAHGVNVTEFYKSRKVSFKDIVMNYKILNDLYKDDPKIVELIKNALTNFLNYKYSVVYIKQLSYANNGQFTIDNHNDMGFMSEYKSLKEKNKFLSKTGEKIIFDMFGYDILLTHPSDRYRKELQSIIGKSSIQTKQLEFFLIKNNNVNQNLLAKIKPDLKEAFIEKEIFEVKNIQIPNKTKILYDSPYCIIKEVL